MAVPQRIAVLRLSALGDAVCIVPLIRELQRQYPSAQITWIISESLYPLFSAIDDIHFIVLKKPRSLGDYYRCWRLLKPYRFDVLIAAHASLRVNCLLPFIRAKRKIGFDKRRAYDGQRLFVHESIPAKPAHYVDTFLQFASYLAQKSLGLATWNLLISSEAKEQVTMQLKGYERWVALTCFTTVAAKDLSMNHVRAVVSALPQSVGVVIVGQLSAEQQVALDRLIDVLDRPILDLTNQLTLPVLAALLSHVDLLVSPDTGPLHLADALGTPVLGLYAATDPRLSGPYHARERCINAYPAACGRSPAPFGQRIYKKGVMNLISPEQVLAEVSAHIV